MSHFIDLLDMSLSLLLHFLPVLSLETSVCSVLKFGPVFSGVIVIIRSVFLFIVNGLVGRLSQSLDKFGKKVVKKDINTGGKTLKPTNNYHCSSGTILKETNPSRNAGKIYKKYTTLLGNILKKALLAVVTLQKLWCT